jgi:hypothetical protein
LIIPENMRQVELQAHALEVLEAVLPVLDALVHGESATVTAAEPQRLEDLFVAITLRASSRLQETLQQLRNDLGYDQLCQPGKRPR